MTPIPRDPSPDATLALLREGYAFISNRCARLHADAFRTRLLLKPVICTMGEEAAAMFYHPGRFTRRGALPPTALKLLQDEGSAQVLDGEALMHRKRMFMSLMTPERVGELVSAFEEAWQARLTAWVSAENIVLHHEVEQILCAAVCRWAGVPLTEAAVVQRTEEFSSMIEGAGAVGPRNWKGLLLRARTEEWMRSVVEGIRAHHMAVPEDSPAQIVAMYRDPDGALLDSASAAAELINLLRPTVAVARYITFAAHAMYRYDECREKIRGSDNWLSGFVQEVRRFYPFFPSVGGRALESFEWRGVQIPGDSWILFDIYGTNHDARIWGDPEAFRPERFLDTKISPFSLVPQGAGDPDTGHRCAGERLTVELVRCAARLLAGTMDYDVPEQDLSIDLSRLPAIPKSRFRISRVSRIGVFEQQARVLRSSERRPG